MDYRCPRDIGNATEGRKEVNRNEAWLVFQPRPDGSCLRSTRGLINVRVATVGEIWKMDARFTGIVADEAIKFCQLLAASGLVTPDDLTAVLQRYCEATPNASSRSEDTLSDFMVSAEVITSWQAEKLRQGRHKGFFIGRYVLLECVVVGDEYSTFAARDVATGHRVLLGIWPPELHGSQRRGPYYRVLDECAGQGTP